MLKRLTVYGTVAVPTAKIQPVQITAWRSPKQENIATRVPIVLARQGS
ncbi:MAG: hypothetical protein KatS3mg016_0886 [Fimbriimonadales bacterium]|nr:MAG: hypothetical protein KatS3mg016_0886 [Fimbriimonadales bacterium]